MKAKIKEVLDRIARAEADEIAYLNQLVEEDGILDLSFQLRYRISRVNTTLVLQNPEKLHEGSLRVLHGTVMDKFSKIGWKVNDGAV